MLEVTRKDVLLAAGLVGITLAIYIPRMGNAFVDWDLEAYQPVLYATNYSQTAWGLITDLKGHIVSGYYAPLSSLSLMTDKWLAGSSVPVARATLLINLLLHCLNGVIVFSLLRRVGGGSWIAAMATFVFLLHPIQVPSVLWFAQRKGLLAGTFYLSAYVAYVHHRQSNCSTTYGVCLALFIAGLLSKPTAVTLPLALFVTELFLADRLGVGAGHGKTGQGLVTREWWSKRILGPLSPGCLIRLAPLFVIAAGFGLVTIGTERVSGQGLPMLERPFIAASVIWFYLGKIVVPINLSPLYPRWNVDLSSVFWWLPLASLGIASFLIAIYRDKIGDRMLWGLANFVVPLLPVIGLFNFAYLDLSLAGDHLVYLAMVGISFCMSLLAFGFIVRIHRPLRYVTAALVVAYLAFFALQTSRQTRIWEDSVSLWTYNLKHNPDDWRSHNSLGHALLKAGQAHGAVEHFRKALELRRALGAVHGEEARRQEAPDGRDRAEQQLTSARKWKEGLARAHYNLGLALWKSGNLSEAIRHFERAVRLNPRFDKALNNLGVVCLLSGKIPAAIEHLRQAIAVNPDNVDARCNLGIALLRSGKLPEAIEEFRQALRHKPDFTKALKDLGIAYLMSGKPSEAVSSLQKAVEINPDDPEAHQSLGTAWTILGNRSRAEIHFKEAKKLGLHRSMETRHNKKERR
ncbi:MAG: tetratricopeptide repeat protein [Deltaproteobacteria bacterium]